MPRSIRARKPFPPRFVQWLGSRNPINEQPSRPNLNLWTGTANVAANGTVIEYKYVIDPVGTWESIPKGNNRLATLPTASGASLALPMVYFADVAPSSISVDLTFQVDMANKLILEHSIPGSRWCIRRHLQQLGTFDAMTNDPTILRTNQNGLVTSNVYVGTYTIEPPGADDGLQVLHRYGNRYEDPAPGTGDPSDHNNRFLNVADALRRCYR